MPVTVKANYNNGSTYSFKTTAGIEYALTVANRHAEKEGIELENISLTPCR